MVRSTRVLLETIRTQLPKVVGTVTEMKSLNAMVRESNLPMRLRDYCIIRATIAEAGENFVHGFGVFMDERFTTGPRNRDINGSGRCVPSGTLLNHPRFPGRELRVECVIEDICNIQGGNFGAPVTSTSSALGIGIGCGWGN